MAMQPLLQTLVFLIEMALAARLTARFNASYEERPSTYPPLPDLTSSTPANTVRPVVTMMVTNALLGGIADTVAQLITAVRHRSSSASASLAKKQDYNIEIKELDHHHMETASAPSDAPPAFDFERLTRFMGYGFCMAPVQFRWFRLLDTTFPMAKGSGAFGPALKRVAMDQILFAPFGVAAFFTAMTIAEGGGRRAVSAKLKELFVPTLKANYVVWPAVQLINFRLMPVQFQLVSRPTLSCKCKANKTAAVCFNGWYCVDRIPFAQQLV